MTLHRAFGLQGLADCRKEEHVALALMIPLVMKMRRLMLDSRVLYILKNVNT